MDTKP